jgi:hypothetical protein
VLATLSLSDKAGSLTGRSSDTACGTILKLSSIRLMLMGGSSQLIRTRVVKFQSSVGRTDGDDLIIFSNAFMLIK